MKKRKKKYWSGTCVYAGRRSSRPDGSRPLQCFVNSDGSKVYYKGIKGVYIGYTYRCSKTQIAVRPERVDVERIDNPAWEGEDALIDSWKAQRRAEDRIKKSQHSAMNAALVALNPLVKGLGYLARRELVSYLVDRVGK